MAMAEMDIAQGDEATMAMAVIAYDKDLLGVPNRRPWKPLASRLAKDDDARDRLARRRFQPLYFCCHAW